MSDSLSINFSHVGVFVQNIDRMIDFYTRVLGFIMSDRGVLDNGTEIAFMTRNPREHHQVVLATGRPDGLSFNVIQQLSFRVGGLDQLREIYRRLVAENVVMEGPTLGPITHGNAISVYCRDPEGQRTEFFIDTPWYVHQPMRIPVDMSMNDAEMWAFVEGHARSLPGFKPLSEWHAEMDRKLAGVH